MARPALAQSHTTMPQCMHKLEQRLLRADAERAPSLSLPNSLDLGLLGSLPGAFLPAGLRSDRAARGQRCAPGHRLHSFSSMLGGWAT